MDFEDVSFALTFVLFPISKPSTIPVRSWVESHLVLNIKKEHYRPTNVKQNSELQTCCYCHNIFQGPAQFNSFHILDLFNNFIQTWIDNCIELMSLLEPN